MGDSSDFRSSSPQQLDEQVKQLKGDIDQLRKEIEEIDSMDIPDDIDKWDPILLFSFQQNFPANIPFPLVADITSVGVLYLVGYFLKDISPQSHNSKNFIISNVSENVALAFGCTPPQMMGLTFSNFSPNYLEETWDEYGMAIFEGCKEYMNFLRVIDFGLKNGKEIFAFDCHVAILKDEKGNPSQAFAFFKKISKMELSFPPEQLKPIVRNLN